MTISATIKTVLIFMLWHLNMYAPLDFCLFVLVPRRRKRFDFFSELTHRFAIVEMALVP